MQITSASIQIQVAFLSNLFHWRQKIKSINAPVNAEIESAMQ